MTVEAPASSANLGPGFDSLALALSRRLRVTVEPAASGATELHVTGEGANRLAIDRSNRFLVGLERGLLAVGQPGGGPWRITMDNQIPLARGLGSSAAATVCGLVAGEALGGVSLGGERLLRLAAEIEGHADNAAAALLGGFVVISGDRRAGWRHTRLEPPAQLRVVLFVPDAESGTGEMRAALPARVAHADAAANVGAAATIVAAMATGRLELLAAMYDDRLHEPYRMAAAFPELRQLTAAARDAGALGAALSGAGSSVIALCGSDAAAAAVEVAFAEAARGAGLAGRSMPAAVETRGARVIE